jgi:hypothetical protein
MCPTGIGLANAVVFRDRCGPISDIDLHVNTRLLTPRADFALCLGTRTLGCKNLRPRGLQVRRARLRFVSFRNRWRLKPRIELSAPFLSCQSLIPLLMQGCNAQGASHFRRMEGLRSTRRVPARFAEYWDCLGADEAALHQERLGDCAFRLSRYCAVSQRPAITKPIAMSDTARPFLRTSRSFSAATPVW